MQIDYTPFCTAQGLSDFSQAVTETVQKLKTALNLDIKDASQQDKLEYWGTEERCHEEKLDRSRAYCYGRHFLIDGKYDFWMGLVLDTESLSEVTLITKVTFEISFSTGKNSKEQMKELIEKYNKLDNKDLKYIGRRHITSVSLKDAYFERFSETVSSQIIFNFACEVFDELTVQTA